MAEARPVIASREATASSEAASRELAIQARELTRKFGSVLAVDHVSLDIERAHIYGFLGPERLRQVDDDPHVLRAAEADVRLGERARDMTCCATPNRCARRSAT